MTPLEDQLRQALIDDAQDAPTLDTQQLVDYATQDQSQSQRPAHRWRTPVLLAACLAVVAVVIPFLAGSAKDSERSASTPTSLAPACPSLYLNQALFTDLGFTIDAPTSAAGGEVVQTAVKLSSTSPVSITITSVVYRLVSPAGVVAAKSLPVDLSLSPRATAEIPFEVALTDCGGAKIAAGTYKLDVLVTVGSSVSRTEQISIRVT